MRMLWWMSGVTRRNKIRNKRIRSSLEVAPIGEMRREISLRGFGVIQRRWEEYR